MSSRVTCSAPWPVEGKPVNTRTPLAGAMRSKPSKDSTRPGRLLSFITTFDTALSVHMPSLSMLWSVSTGH